MKNRKTKHLLVLAVCLAISVTCFWNCQSEDHHSHDYHIFGLENVSRKHQKRMVSLDDITGVREHVEKRLNTKLSQRSSEINGAIFDEDNVLEVIDSLDNANYSLRFRFPNTPIKEFYNLVVGRTPEGELKTPYVLKYTCNDAFVDEFISNDFNFFYFKGTVDVHKYTDFFDVGSFSRTTTECETQFDAVGDPISCESNYVDGGTSTSGGGSTGSSTGTGNDGSGSNGSSSNGGGSFSGGCSYLGIYVLNCGGSNSDNLHLLSECGGPDKNSADQFAVWDCEGATRRARTADCHECGGDSEGAVGINPPSTTEMVNTIQNALNIPRGSYSLTYLSENPDNTVVIYNFLTLSGINGDYSQSTLNFLAEVLEALVDNPTTISSNDYPGINEGFPFEWWKDTGFVNENISFNLEGFNDLTRAEKMLILLFPIQAFIIKNNKQPAQIETESRFGTNGINDKSDAFRHAFFNAMNSNDVPDKIARLFSTAHESEVPVNLNLEVQMDLFNNNVGHIIGNNANNSVSDQTLANEVYQSLINGNLKYLFPINYNDPNFWDDPSTSKPNDGSHGITSLTLLIPTN